MPSTQHPGKTVFTYQVRGPAMSCQLCIIGQLTDSRILSALFHCFHAVLQDTNRALVSPINGRSGTQCIFLSDVVQGLSP